MAKATFSSYMSDGKCLNQEFVQSPKRASAGRIQLGITPTVESLSKLWHVSHDAVHSEHQ